MKPGRTGAPLSASFAVKSVKTVSDVYTRTVRARGRSPTNRTPARKYSLRLRAISPSVLLAARTSTAKSARRSAPVHRGAAGQQATPRNEREVRQSYQAGQEFIGAVRAVRMPRFCLRASGPIISIKNAARSDSRSPIGFSTRVSSISSQRWFSSRSRSSTVAVPGTGVNRTRSGGMSPNRWSRSAMVRTGGLKVLFMSQL